MDSLRRIGISTELSRSEFIAKFRYVSCSSRKQTNSLRICRNFLSVSLASDNSQLFSRRKIGGGKSVVQKHSDDIWTLVCSIKIKLAPSITKKWQTV